jgi:hypothetical protein
MKNPMKTSNKHWLILPGIFSIGLVIGATALTAWSQTAPVLTIKPQGTNEFFIGFTNNIGAASYDLLWTPSLAGPDYSWQWKAIGTPGQTNFLVTGVYSTEFYTAILDTNSVPLWKAADPDNPAAGILTVTIDSPANGFLIQ